MQAADPTTRNAALSVVTMLHDDLDFLDIWLGYWRRQLPEDRLWVISHGDNAEIARRLGSVNLVVHPRHEPYPEMEEDRWAFLSGFMVERLQETRVAVYTDVDEILVADPRRGRGIAERLGAATAPVSFARGIELIHRPDAEPDPIDLSQPVLAQRRFFRRTSFHSKPCILTAPVSWGRGGHFCDRKGVRFLPHVYAVHLRFYDLDRFWARRQLRRETTLAPDALESMPGRRWRRDDAAAQEMIETFAAWHLPRRESLSTWPMDLRMRLSAGRKPDAKGLYRYDLRHGKGLQKLPETFARLF